MEPEHVISKEDWTFLTETGYPYDGMISDLLSQREIPFVTKGIMGAGMALKVGVGIEDTQFYVPHSYLERAKELIDGMVL